MRYGVSGVKNGATGSSTSPCAQAMVAMSFRAAAISMSLRGTPEAGRKIFVFQGGIERRRVHGLWYEVFAGWRRLCQQR